MDYLEDWAKKNNHEIRKKVLDEESGTIPLTERRKFRKLLEEKKAEGMAVSNLDRLTRNWDDVTFIEKQFRDNWDRYKLISTSDEVNLFNASGRAMFRIKMAINCMMPEDMREKQKIGIERAKKEGKYKYGRGRPKNIKINTSNSELG
jgi:DNA invertase Pin-like site-specific DNA recombinase